MGNRLFEYLVERLRPIFVGGGRNLSVHSLLLDIWAVSVGVGFLGKGCTDASWRNARPNVVWLLFAARLRGKYRVLFLTSGHFAFRSKALYGRTISTSIVPVIFVNVKVTLADCSTSLVCSAELTR